MRYFRFIPLAERFHRRAAWAAALISDEPMHHPSCLSLKLLLVAAVLTACNI